MYQKVRKNQMIRNQQINLNETIYKKSIKFLSYKRPEVKKFVKKIATANGIGILEYKKNGNVLMVYDELEKKFNNFEILEIENEQDINIKLTDSILEKAKEKILILTLYMDFNKFKNIIKTKSKEKYFNILNKTFFIIN